jgi:hypothetical protein
MTIIKSVFSLFILRSDLQKAVVIKSTFVRG